MSGRTPDELVPFYREPSELSVFLTAFGGGVSKKRFVLGFGLNLMNCGDERLLLALAVSSKH